MAGRKSNETKQAEARETLIQTIAKIQALEPTLGGKWQAKMVLYYRSRLAELVLRQCGFSAPSALAISNIADRISDILD